MAEGQEQFETGRRTALEEAMREAGLLPSSETDNEASAAGGDAEQAAADASEEEAEENTEDTVDAEAAEADAGKSEDTEDAQEDEGSDEEGSDEDPPVEAIEPPAGFSEEERATFKELTPEAQKFLVERLKPLPEADQHVSDFQKRFDSMIEPYRASLEAGGLDPIGFTGKLLKAHEVLTASPVESIAWLMGQYGADPSAVVAHLIQSGKVDPARFQTATEDDDPYEDEGIKRLASKVDKVEQSLTAQERAREQEAQRQAEAERNRLLETWNAFKGTKSEDGNLRYPDAEALRGSIATFLGNGEAAKAAAAEKGVSPTAVSDEEALAKAYDMAAYANPSTRERFIKAERARAVAEAKEAEKKAAGDAKKKAEREKARKAKEASKAAAGVRSGGDATTPSETGKKSRRDLIADQINSSFQESAPAI